MKDDAAWRNVAIRNVSNHGVMLQIANPPPRGRYVEIQRDSLVIVGRVMWSEPGACGLRTHEVLSLPATGTLAATPPGVHAVEPGTFQHRKAARTPEEIAESAVIASRRMQFALMGTACAAAVSALAFVAFRWLAAPAEIISAALS